MSGCARILVVDDNPRNLRMLSDRLAADGHTVTEASSGAEALARARDEGPDLVLLDIVMPGMDGYQVLKELKADASTRRIPVIVISAVDEVQSVVRCLELGADDYVTKPFDPVILRARTGACLERRHAERALEEANELLERRVAERTAALELALEEVRSLKNRLEAENVYLQEQVELAHNVDAIVFRSAAFAKVLDAAARVAPTDATVLILGETGTGKELVARAIHRSSPRRDRPLVKVNCAALPASLIESELFGHERGAFTGAVARRIGRFELADSSTLFLDEVAELPLELQAKLLRVLQEGEIERLGGTTTIKVNVRVIAATNRSIEAAVAGGAFREDLYYRLNVFPITCPPLRERKEDIPLLVEHFVRKHREGTGRKTGIVPPEVAAALERYDWPGNVRELENVVERALIMSRGDRLELGDWLPGASAPRGQAGFATLADAERSHIREALEVSMWKVRGENGAARRLGLKPTTLEARMKKLGITRTPGP